MGDHQRMVVWWKDEFDEYDADEREERGWKVPGENGILNPDRIYHCDDVEEAARAYADYFFHHRDGYDDNWPQLFVVLDTDTDKYFVVSVEMEYEPSFSSATPVDLEVAAPEQTAGAS